MGLNKWNPSCEAISFSPEKWPFKSSGLASGIEINTFMLKFSQSSTVGLCRRGGLLSDWPLKRGFTV